MIIASSRRALATAIVLLMAITGVSAAGLPARAGAEPVPELFERVTVWAAGENGMEAHRIPGIAVTTQGTVLAVSEARIGIGDRASHELVYKRSLDGGRTWLSTGIIEPAPNGESWLNPTLLVERETGRIFLFYNISDGVTSEVFYRSSDDDGVSWSDRVNVTPMFDELPYGWTSHSPGPGHAIQLADGRLLLQVWHRKSVELPVGERDYGISTIYSDDQGTTWHNGGAIAPDPAYPINESRLMERSDGSIVVIGRFATGTPLSRIVSVSHDQGMTWSPFYLHGSFRPAVAADAGMARLSGGPASADISRVLFSRLDNRARRDLTVALSYDDGDSFPREKVIQAGSAGYSDIAVLGDGTVLVLYEVIPEIVVARFDVEWLTGGQDSLEAGPGLTRHLIEAEDADAAGSAPVSVAEDPNAHGGQRVDLAAGGAGDHLEVTLDVPDAGAYDVHLRMPTQPDRGTVQVSIDGVDLGDVVDAATERRGYPEITIPDVSLSAGQHVVRLTVVGQGPLSTGFGVGLDYVSLTRFDPPAPRPACEQTVSGTHTGPLTVTGRMLCLDGATVTGPVTVTGGGGLRVTDSVVHGPVRVTGTEHVSVCDTDLTGPLSITDATETVILGGVACAPNVLRGPVAVQDSAALVRIVGNEVWGPLRVSGTTARTAAVLAANRVHGPLACSGNAPAPGNDGHPNSVTGPSQGQCAGL